MKVKSGIDIVYVPRFKKVMREGGPNFLKRVFVESELIDQRITRLAGIFAAKEAVIKALSLPTDSWHNIQIYHQKNGNPQVQLLTSHLSPLTSALSISHDGNYVIAQFVAILK